MEFSAVFSEQRLLRHPRNAYDSMSLLDLLGLSKALSLSNRQMPQRVKSRLCRLAAIGLRVVGHGWSDGRKRYPY